MIVLCSNCLLLKCWVSFEFLSVLCETFIDIWIKLLSIKGNVLNFPTRNVLTSWFWNKFKNTKCKIKKKPCHHSMNYLNYNPHLYCSYLIILTGVLFGFPHVVSNTFGVLSIFILLIFFCHLALASQQKQFSDPNMEYLSCGRSNFWKDE